MRQEVLSVQAGILRVQAALNRRPRVELTTPIMSFRELKEHGDPWELNKQTIPGKNRR